MSGRQGPQCASMIRRMTGGPAGRNGVAADLAAVALAAALLLPAAPAEAGGWLGRAVGVAGAARSLKRNMGEAVDLLEETLGAAVQLDHEEVERLSGELIRFPGRIMTDAFVALSIGAGALEKAKAANEGLKTVRQRVGRFVGDAVTDARMALETGEYELETGVLDPKRPLPAVTLSGPAGTSRPAPSGSSAASTPDPWGQESEEGEETATGGADPWGQDPEDEEPVAGDVDPPGEEGQAEREGGDVATERLQTEYAAALDRFLGAEEGSSDYEATLSALLEQEKKLLAAVAGQEEEQELTPDERRRVQACLQEREFEPGAADGVFGPRTRTAIRAWQAVRGREKSGRLDAKSAQKLLEECEVAVAKAATETTTESAERTFEPKCANVFDGPTSDATRELFDKIEVCYLEFANRPGCHLALNKRGKIIPSSGKWNLSINRIGDWIEYHDGQMETTRLRWSGGCSGGVPDGQGTLSAVLPRYLVQIWASHDWELSQEWTGQFVDGAPQGKWTMKYRNAGSTVLNGDRHPFEHAYEETYLMMNGQVHGEHIRILKDSGSAHNIPFRSVCSKSIGKFVNEEYHHGSSSSC